MSQLFTWRDVEAALLAAGSPWLDARVSPECVEIILNANDDEERARDVLKDRFGVSYHQGAIQLVTLPGISRTLPVHLFVADDDDKRRIERLRAVAPRPLWSDPLPTVIPAASSASDRNLCVFFSYKGGVGRTTVTVAVLGELLRRQRGPEPRVLLIDADVEAPGLSWLLRQEGRVSLIDIFGMIHDTEDWRDAIPLIKGLVESSREAIEFPDHGRREFFFVPAVRDIEQVFRLPLTPEHLVRGRGRERVIGDFLVALAEAMDLDAILVDTRAGITEFSSPLLLDARARAVLVTSCNRQAVGGTVATLRHLRVSKRDVRTDSVVITFVPPDRNDLAKEVQEEIFAAVDGEGNEATDDDPVSDLDRFPLIVPFAQELLYDGSLTDLLVSRVPGTQLGKTVAPALADLFTPRASVMAIDDSAARALAGEGPPTYERVHDQAKELEFAENNKTLGFLPIPALRSLVDQPPGRLPAAVVLGAKGAGKTFAWGQMVLSGTWEEFHRQIHGTPPASSPVSRALVFPLLHPKNLDRTLSERVKQAETDALATRKSTLDSLGLSTKIEEAKSRDVGLQFWLTAICDRLGLYISTSVRDLEAQLRQHELRVIFVIDGIEDALQLASEERLSEHRRRLLRLLLQDLTLNIRDLGSEYLGIVTFVRRDYAIEALAQNFRQFESLHRQHALQWSTTEALRLPLWLCSRLGWDLLPKDQIETASYDELRRALVPFWGERMGKSKYETFCDQWIIAALSDLNGRIQARDLVRLIRFATAENKLPQGWPISPRRLRAALQPCAQFKVEELEKETRTLRPILNKLRSVVTERKVIPFIPRKLADSPSKRLDRDQIQFLEDQGLITKLDGESEEYYMPEIIRQGLGYRLAGGRRAKVLSLYRAALARGQT